MISVSIFINNKPIVTRSAVNLDKNRDNGMDKVNEYRLDTGEVIEHIPEDGCIALAKKMLNTVDKRFEHGL